jgi:hypothetical protein
MEAIWWDLVIVEVDFRNSHIIFLEKICKVSHALVIQFCRGEIYFMKEGDDWSQLRNSLGTQVVITQIKDSELNELGIGQFGKVVQTVCSKIVVAEPEFTYWTESNSCWLKDTFDDWNCSLTF